MTPAKKAKKPARSALGDANDPLAAVIPSGGPTPRKKGARPAAVEAGPVKVRATFHLTGDLLDRLRAAAVECRLTLAELAEEALTREVARLEKVHNAGRPFAPLKARMRTGRPIGT